MSKIWFAFIAVICLACISSILTFSDLLEVERMYIESKLEEMQAQRKEAEERQRLTELEERLKEVNVEIEPYGPEEEGKGGERGKFEEKVAVYYIDSLKDSYFESVLENRKVSARKVELIEGNIFSHAFVGGYFPEEGLGRLKETKERLGKKHLSMMMCWYLFLRDDKREWLMVLDDSALVPKDIKEKVMQRLEYAAMDTIWIDTRSGSPPTCCILGSLYNRKSILKILLYSDPTGTFFSDIGKVEDVDHVLSKMVENNIISFFHLPLLSPNPRYTVE